MNIIIAVKRMLNSFPFPTKQNSYCSGFNIINMSVIWIKVMKDVHEKHYIFNNKNLVAYALFNRNTIDLSIYTTIFSAYKGGRKIGLSSLGVKRMCTLNVKKKCKPNPLIMVFTILFKTNDVYFMALKSSYNGWFQ